MPAIQLSRLKIQTANLMEYFDQPAIFRIAFHDLLNTYADHTHRSGQSGIPPSLISAYNVPPQVIRQILKESKEKAGKDIQSTLSLCDMLWDEPYLEFRILAAGLLGEINPDPVEPVLERIQRWISPGLEDRLLGILLTQGMTRLRKDNCPELLELIKDWLNASDLWSMKIGLISLKGYADDLHYNNLPVLFRLVSPFLRVAPLDLRPEILSLLLSLIHRSPQETAFVLRQNLTTPENPDTSWIIRQVLPEFPFEIQGGLQQAIRQL